MSLMKMMREKNFPTKDTNINKKEFFKAKQDIHVTM